MMLNGYGLSLNNLVPNHRLNGYIGICLFGEQEKACKLIQDELYLKQTRNTQIYYAL